MLIPKHKRYRNKKILKAAQGQYCTYRSPWCNHDHNTVVACHKSGAGMGMKADDDQVFFGCSACHDIYDGRMKSPLSRDQREQMAELAILETQQILRQMKLL